MKKQLLILSFLGIIALAGCGNGSNPSVQSGESTQTTTTITDMIGREVDIKTGTYERVVCIGAGALRLYSYVGDVNKLAGVESIDNSTISNRPKMFDGVARPYYIANKDVFDTLPSCGLGGPNGQTAEPEAILSCNPDIVISEYEDVEKENALQEAIGVPVITVSYGSKGVFDDNAKNSINLLGTIFGRSERAATLNGYIASEAAAIQNRVKDIQDSDKPNVYICGLGNWGTTNHLMTAKNYEPFNVAGIKNVVTDIPAKDVASIDAEKFVSLGSSMDIMFIDAAAVKNIKPLYEEDPTMFNTCKAWNEGKVYLQMAYNAYYTNLEIALCNTWYNAKIVYPSLFEDIDIDTKLGEITTAFLGKNLVSEIKAYPNSFGGYQQIDTASFFNA